MKRNSGRWLALLMTAVGCGHIGLEDLERGEGAGGAFNDTGSGGKTGDGALGGSMIGMGGMGTGGGVSGFGGEEPGAGGANAGTGGVWEPDVEIWTDPNRDGCWPFCPMINPSFSTHYLFEQAVVPAPGVESNGELFVATDYANWGASSLGVSFDEAPAHAYIPISIDTSVNGSIYVRAFLYIPSGVISGDVGLLEFLSGDTLAAAVKTHPAARLSAEAPIHQDRAMSATNTYPFDEWFCLRAAVHLDDVIGSVTVEAGDVVVAEILGADTRTLRNESSVHFGVTGTSPHQGAGQLYWDSLVIDQQPVACDDMSIPL